MSSQPAANAAGETVCAPHLPTMPDDVQHASKAPETDNTIFGSFWLDQSEFALDASVIQEVVNEPERISPMPLAPAYMVGLFNIRGTIVPVIDLRRLLELPEKVVPDRKVAIVDDGEICIGLLVDRTGEVLNVQRTGRVNFQARQGEIKDIVIQGLLKLDQGQRIVQILDPHLLLDLEKVPRTTGLAQRRNDRVTEIRGERFNCITFQFGHTSCAIDLRHVEEVMDAPEINGSMLAQDCFIGVTNLRGQILPVADARNFMGDSAKIIDSAKCPPPRKMLIIQTEGGLVGMLVYSIDSIVSCFEDEVLQFTKLALPRADLVKGCIIAKNEEIVLVLDQDALKRDRVLVETALRCKEVHPDEGRPKAEKKDVGTGGRLTFIVFTLSTRSALNSAEVSEIIPFPERLLRPPYALDFVEGIINLRGELITLINPRTVYGMPEIDPPEKRVLIFLHGGRKYGILVDSVDEIVNTTANCVSDKMTIKQANSTLQMFEDDGGCIQSPSYGAVMVLDIESFLSRCFQKAGDTRLDAAPKSLQAPAPAPFVAIAEAGPDPQA